MNPDPHLVTSYKRTLFWVLFVVLFLHLGAYQNQQLLPFLGFPALFYLLGGYIAHHWFPFLSKNIFLLAVAVFIGIIIFPVLLLLSYDAVMIIWNIISVDAFMLVLGASVAGYYENALRPSLLERGRVSSLADSHTSEDERGRLLYQNGSAEDSRKYNRGSGNDGEQTFCLYEHGLLELPTNRFTPVGDIEATIVDGGSGLFTYTGPARNIWFNIHQEQRHFSLVSATKGWIGELERVLIGGSVNITRYLMGMGFRQKTQGIVSGKITFVKHT